MGWFDSITDFFGGGSGLVQAGAAIANTIIADRANDKAADRAKAAAEEDARLRREANEQAQRRFEEIQRQTAPANSYLRSVYANPNALNPLQRQQLEETRRTVANQLATSGLRGSGRAQVAALRGVESDFINRAVDANLRRADQAAQQQSSQGYNATSQMAGLDAATGRAAGDAALRGGIYQAEGDLATAQTQTRAIADLAGFMASEAKGRRSRQQAAKEEEEV